MKQSLSEEKRELDVKIDKLTEFLKHSTIPQAEVYLLEGQLETMQAYSNILATRLAQGG